MSNLLCKIFGHKWYHKNSLCPGEGKEPFKRYCSRCVAEQYMIYKKLGNIRYYWKTVE
jgi:hypothetical protein